MPLSTKISNLDYQSNLEIYEGKNLITNIDLLIKIGKKKIGIAECKSTIGFTETQVNELIKITSKNAMSLYRFF